MTEFKKAIYQNGVTTYVDITPEEIAALSALQQSQEWHDETCQFRLFMNDEQYVDMLASNAGLPLMQALREANLMIAKADGGRYIYYNFLYPEHEDILRLFNADFQTKSPD
ncbi:MAG: hypothetical protein GX587_15460 [Bacteroidales bacterium]|nr:hypothetical protein [Bacteroidales bacterium]